MRKINKLKIALLAASSMLVSGTASAQVVDAWKAGAIEITSENTGASVELGNVDAPAATEGATITAGTRNSISASAVGASASVSLNSTTIFDGEVTGEVGAITVEGTNSASVSNVGSVTGAEIAAGVQNGISRSAVGSSAATSVNIVADGGAIHEATYTLDDVGVTSTNSGDVAIGVSLGTAGTAADAPTITAGTNNSISATAVGASGSMSIATTVLDGASESTTVTVGDVTIEATNTGAAVSVASADDADTAGGIFGATITGGVGNSISANAIGTSASFAYSNTLAIGEGSSIASVDTIGAVELTSTNGADVSNFMDIGVSGSTADAAHIGIATNSSIGVAGIGASASLSYGSNDLTAGSGETANDVLVGASTIGAENTGNVTVASNFFNPSIAGGYGNSVSMAAVGASASQTFNNFAR